MKPHFQYFQDWKDCSAFLTKTYRWDASVPFYTCPTCSKKCRLLLFMYYESRSLHSCIETFLKKGKVPLRLSCSREMHQTLEDSNNEDLCCWMIVFSPPTGASCVFGAVASTDLVLETKRDTYSLKLAKDKLDQGHSIHPSDPLGPFMSFSLFQSSPPPLQNAKTGQKRKVFLDGPVKDISPEEKQDRRENNNELDFLVPSDPVPMPKHVKLLSTSLFNGYSAPLSMTLVEHRTWGFAQTAAIDRFKLFLESPDRWDLRLQSPHEFPTDSLCALLCLPEGVSIEKDQLGFVLMKALLGVHQHAMWMLSERRLWEWRMRHCPHLAQQWHQVFRSQINGYAEEGWTGSSDQLNVLLTLSPMLPFTIEQGLVRCPKKPIRDLFMKQRWMSVVLSPTVSTRQDAALIPKSIGAKWKVVQLLWTLSAYGPSASAWANVERRAQQKRVNSNAHEFEDEDDPFSSSKNKLKQSYDEDGNAIMDERGQGPVTLPVGEGWEYKVLPPCMLKIQQTYNKGQSDVGDVEDWDKNDDFMRAPLQEDEDMEDEGIEEPLAYSSEGWASREKELTGQVKIHMKNDARRQFLHEMQDMGLSWSTVNSLLQGPLWTDAHRNKCKGQWTYYRSTKGAKPASQFEEKDEEKGKWKCLYIQKNDRLNRFCPFSFANKPYDEMEDVYAQKFATSLEQIEKRKGMTCLRRCRDHMERKVQRLGQHHLLSSMPKWRSPSELGTWLLQHIFSLQI